MVNRVLGGKEGISPHKVVNYQNRPGLNKVINNQLKQYNN